jgi:hypothetical protein
MRLTPLLLVVSIGKNVAPPTPGLADAMQSNLVRVAKLLLKHGARPDARDVAGKTVFHYGAGAMATDMTLKVAEMCLRAHERGGSHGGGGGGPRRAAAPRPGDRVELLGLEGSGAELNGARGTARGYDPDAGRRLVSIAAQRRGAAGGRRIVAVKDENLRIVDDDNNNPNQDDAPPFIRLCDMQDRLGGVCLLEAVMQERLDVATFLLERVGARVDVSDCDGISPLSLSTNAAGQMGSRVCRLVSDHSIRATRKERNRHCSHCGKAETPDAALSLCGSWYVIESGYSYAWFLSGSPVTNCVVPPCHGSCLTSHLRCCLYSVTQLGTSILLKGLPAAALEQIAQS